MFRCRGVLLSACAVFALAAAPASAAEIQFDPDGAGAGAAVGVATLDQFAGAALATTFGGAPITITTPVGTSFSLLYQANLSGALDENGDPVNLGGNAFHFVAEFTETITGVGVTSTGEIAIDFAFNPAAPNVFNMYTGFGASTSGLGFASGAPILSGHAIAQSFDSAFQFKNPAGATGPCPSPGNPVPPGVSYTNLDCFGGDNYSTIDTLVGTGGTQIAIEIDNVDPTYFPNLNVGSTLIFTTTLNVLPFSNVNPSNCFQPFSPAGVPLAKICGLAGMVGAINGVTGPDTTFQTDASSSFIVPEPTALALMGIGLLGSAAGLRRRFSRR